jgi:hypothetical protein
MLISKKVTPQYKTKGKMPFGQLRQFCVDSVSICKTSLMALATVEMAVSRERQITTHVI